MKIKLLSMLFLATALSISAQIAPDKYFVKFTDKDNSPFSIDNPSEYLSQRAIDRRASQGIPIDFYDLPVNPAYVAGVAATGAELLNRTKWLNGLTIYTTDPQVLAAIELLPYVESVTAPGKSAPSGDEEPALFEKPFFKNEIYGQPPVTAGVRSGSSASFNYGQAYNQIAMLNGDQLHEMGFRGEGKVIAVLDAGFINANTLPVFDSLWDNGRILGSRDFVKGGEVTFDEHTHGTMVLSTMGGNQPGQLIGTAPKASYWLLRSEDGATEYIIEEYNWVSAAEYADSVGADIINSSLGYTEFNAPSQNHVYADLDGNTTPITIGADRAASRGILVVNSLGNSGSDSWYYLGAPSDGDSVLGVGAVDANGHYVYFSSHGPSYDGRVKPNLVAQGSGAWVVEPWSGSFMFGSGTSFSSPILAGISACLWQASPGQTNMQLLDAMQQTASHYNTPTDTLGYGIPDMIAAKNILTIIDTYGPLAEPLFTYPNPFYGTVHFRLDADKAQDALVEISDVTGRRVYQSEITGFSGNSITLSGLDELPQGMYFIKVRAGEKLFLGKAVKGGE